MSHAVTLIPGDGTGSEITQATCRVLEATGVRFDWDLRLAGVETLEKYGTVLPGDDSPRINAGASRSSFLERTQRSRFT
jgi:isocitrate/isopropylmalate dehydrogenase